MYNIQPKNFELLTILKYKVKTANNFTFETAVKMIRVW